MKITCHNCGVEGHKSTYCQEEKLNEVERAKIMLMNPSTQIQNLNVTCFSCLTKGHYANACPFKANLKAM
jgi:hypothetical protein